MALTDCDLKFLTLNDLREVCRDYPAVKAEMHLLQMMFQSDRVHMVQDGWVSFFVPFMPSPKDLKCHDEHNADQLLFVAGGARTQLQQISDLLPCARTHDADGRGWNQCFRVDSEDCSEDGEEAVKAPPTKGLQCSAS